MDSVAKTRRILWIPGGNHQDSFYGQHASHTPVMRIDIKEKPPGRFQKALKSGKRDSSPLTRDLACGLSRYLRYPRRLMAAAPRGLRGRSGEPLSDEIKRKSAT